MNARPEEPALSAHRMPAIPDGPPNPDRWYSDMDNVRVEAATRFAAAYNMRSIAPLRDIHLTEDFLYTSHWYPLKEKTSRLFIRHFYRRFIEHFMTNQRVRCELVETRGAGREVQVAVCSGQIEVAAGISTVGHRVSSIHMMPLNNRIYRSGCLPGTGWTFTPPVPEQRECILGIMQGVYMDLLRQRIEEFCSGTLGLKCWVFCYASDAGSFVDVHLPPPAAPHRPIRIPFPGEAAWEQEVDLFDEFATSIERKIVEVAFRLRS